MGVGRPYHQGLLMHWRTSKVLNTDHLRKVETLVASEHPATKLKLLEQNLSLDPNDGHLNNWMQKMTRSLDFPPLEYIPTKPPHSTYVIDNCFVLVNVKRGRNILTPPFPLCRAGKTIDIYIFTQNTNCTQHPYQCRPTWCRHLWFFLYTLKTKQLSMT